MDTVRLATAEEVDKIKGDCDLTSESQVIAFGAGEKTDFAVLRRVLEVDPVLFSKDSDDRRKYIFMRDIETGLRFTGVAEYYFNILASDERWLKVVKNWGAEEVSKAPEVRLKKKLL